MSARRVAAAALALAALSSAPAHALDGMSLELGTGDNVNMGRVAVQWELAKPLLQFRNWQLGNHFDLAVGYWKAKDATTTQHDELFELAFTPVLRIQGNGRVGPYVELGLGMHLLTESSIADTRMSTAFQFGNHIGLGYRFGQKGAFDVAYRFQHLSNASIKRPNAGINFQQVRLGYWY